MSEMVAMTVKATDTRRYFPLKAVVASILLVLVAGCMRWGEDSDESSLVKSFREVIGFAPTATVLGKKSAYYDVRDSYIRWLCFTCDQATISKIRALGMGKPQSAGYWTSRAGPGRHDGTNPNAPDWWKNVDSSLDLEEIDIDHSTDRNTDVTHIWIDNRNHAVYAVRDVLY